MRKWSESKKNRGFNGNVRFTIFNLMHLRGLLSALWPQHSNDKGVQQISSLKYCVILLRHIPYNHFHSHLIKPIVRECFKELLYLSLLQ